MRQPAHLGPVPARFGSGLFGPCQRGGRIAGQTQLAVLSPSEDYLRRDADDIARAEVVQADEPAAIAAGVDEDIFRQRAVVRDLEGCRGARVTKSCWSFTNG